MKIHADWLSIPSTRLVMDKLLSKGFQAYFVGGCVRNSILDTEVKDIDISTSAHPIEVLEMMKKAGLKAVPTGICLLYTSPSPRDE